MEECQQKMNTKKITLLTAQNTKDMSSIFYVK